jgi:hypothetical protein
VINGFLKQAVALVLAAGASGCYRYVPSQLGTVPPGQQVRVYVTQEALAKLTDLPATESTSLSGVLIRTEAQNVVVRLPVARRQSGFSMEVLGQDVFIPRDQILQIERRELNKPMTVVATVGASAALAGAVVLIIDNASNGELLPGSGGGELHPGVAGAP